MRTGAHNSPRLARPAPALLRALDGERPDRTPVWFMRQAGRSLPEYRALRRREGAPMLDICLRPEQAAEITLQPVRRHGVDAAILFSDIMVPLRLAGVGVRIEPGVGPVITPPVRDAAQVAELTARRYGEGPDGAAGAGAIGRAVALAVTELGSPTAPDPGGAAGASGTVSASGTAGPSGVPGPGAGGSAEGAGAAPSARSPLGRELSGRELAGLAHSAGRAGWTPLIGFGGAPFTLAAYLVEGRPSRDHLAARTLMHADPAAWDRLMTWCAHLTGDFIATQVEAGASAVQLFDSWAGSLSPADYRARVAPYSALAIERARRAVSPTTGRPAPLIHFGTGTARILVPMHDAGARAVGVDERTDLAEAIEALADSAGGPCPVQGNIDPALLGAGAAPLERAVETCLAAGRAAPAHVVNLGHGVPPGADPAVLTGVVARVHGSTSWARTAAEPWEPDA
ncbi:uroporphyrinogen decarboxylase [Actinomyces dentalis]|uniref:uroporphyrinogen decarboxylase n=1 Tax=Actinomyces dentalis TaxID=272548 RepID=UPI000415A74C|nr:uroporphyrinogen decarboxylase [Actinomyces dentalis]